MNSVSTPTHFHTHTKREKHNRMTAPILPSSIDGPHTVLCSTTFACALKYKKRTHMHRKKRETNNNKKLTSYRAAHTHTHTPPSPNHPPETQKRHKSNTALRKSS
jgi:hypothetical protein